MHKKIPLYIIILLTCILPVMCQRGCIVLRNSLIEWRFIENGNLRLGYYEPEEFQWHALAFHSIRTTTNQNCMQYQFCCVHGKKTRSYFRTLPKELKKEKQIKKPPPKLKAFRVCNICYKNVVPILKVRSPYTHVIFISNLINIHLVYQHVANVERL